MDGANADITAVQALWPTPLGRFRYTEAATLNPLLSRMFGAMRALALGDADLPAFYASDDDLLTRIDLSEWRHFVQFVVRGIEHTAAVANREIWGPGARALRLDIAGMWFQISNRDGGHDMHTHGNCSWSGVYYVQADPADQRIRHSSLSSRNGVTRFYGDYFAKLGGAHADFGNAYLQQCHFDIEPDEGLLAVFPSWLPHRALPYAGERDRIVISFNARVNRTDGDNKVFGYAES